MRKKIKQLQKPFKKELIEKIALETGFIKRNRKLNATKFLETCVFNSNSICDISLNDLSTQYNLETGISISKQALNDKFNRNAVDFFRKVFENVLYSHSNISKENLVYCESLFKRIRIMDSSRIELPAKFREIYGGNGGGASKAAAKFNVEYDLLTGEFNNVGFFSGTKSDPACMHEVIDDVEAGDLCIKDLGYFNLKVFGEINKKDAYYISKIKSTTSVYSDNDDYEKYYYNTKRNSEPRKIDIAKVTETLCEGESIELDNIYIGQAHSIKSRLIITKLPKEIKENRRKKREKKASKRNLKSSSDKFDGANAYITNITKEKLDMKSIAHLYKLRWGIMLISA